MSYEWMKRDIEFFFAYMAALIFNFFKIRNIYGAREN